MALPGKPSRRTAAMAVSSVVLCMLSASAAAVPSSLYVFGDSLSDNGNLYAWTSNPSNPVTFGLPIPVSPPYEQGTFTNGPVYAERLWDRLGLPGELAPAALPGGTNHAVGGRARATTPSMSAPTACRRSCGPPTSRPSA